MSRSIDLCSYFCSRDFAPIHNTAQGVQRIITGIVKLTGRAKLFSQKFVSITCRQHVLFARPLLPFCTITDNSGSDARKNVYRLVREPKILKVNLKKKEMWKKTNAKHLLKSVPTITTFTTFRCIAESGACDAKTLPEWLQPKDGSCGAFTVVTVLGPGGLCRSETYQAPTANTRQQNMILFRDCALRLLLKCLSSNSIISKL